MSRDSATSTAVRPGEGLSSVKHRKTRNPQNAVVDRTCPLGNPEDGNCRKTWMRSALGRGRKTASLTSEPTPMLMVANSVETASQRRPKKNRTRITRALSAATCGKKPSQLIPYIR